MVELLIVGAGPAGVSAALWARTQNVAARLIETAAVNLSGHTIGDRPDRTEPRAVKRRPKPHDLLNKPRAEARAELLGRKSP